MAAAAAFIAFPSWLATMIDILDFMILALKKVRNFGVVFVQTLVYVLQLKGELLRLKMLTMGLLSLRQTIGALSMGMSAGRWFKHWSTAQAVVVLALLRAAINDGFGRWETGRDEVKASFSFFCAGLVAMGVSVLLGVVLVYSIRRWRGRLHPHHWQYWTPFSSSPQPPSPLPPFNITPEFTSNPKRAYIEEEEEEEEDEYIYNKSIVARHEWPHAGLIYSRQAQHKASCFEPPQPPDFSTHVCPPIARFQFAVAWLIFTFVQLYHRRLRSSVETILTHTLLLPLVTTVTLISSLLPEFPFTTTRPGRIAITILILPLCVQASISFVVLSTTLGLAPKTTMMFQFLWRCLGRPPILQPVDVETGLKRRHSHHYHDEKISSQRSTPSYDEKSPFLEDKRAVIENERERIRAERDELSAEQTRFRKQQEKQAQLIAMAEQKIEKYVEMELELKRQERIQVQKIEEDQIRLALRSAQLEAREIEAEKRARIVQHRERVVERREINLAVREREVKELMQEWEGRRDELVRIVENVEEKARRQKKVMDELMRLRGSTSVVNEDTTIASTTITTTTTPTTAATTPRTPTTHSRTSSTSSTTTTAVKSSRPTTPAPQRFPSQRTPQNRPSTPSSSRPATPSTPRGSLQPAKKMPLSTRSGNGPAQIAPVQRSAAGSLRSPSRLSPRQQNPQVVGQVRRKQAVVNGA